MTIFKLDEGVDCGKDCVDMQRPRRRRTDAADRQRRQGGREKWGNW
jgi:hypothetical protein